MGRRNTLLLAETLKRQSGAEKRKSGTSMEEEQRGASKGAGQAMYDKNWSRATGPTFLENWQERTGRR
jgi:hypothetical protein